LVPSLEARRKRPNAPPRAPKPPRRPARLRNRKPALAYRHVSSSTTQALSGAGGSSDVFNSEKVEAMKAAIADGSFKVNPEAIADKMLSNAAEMLSSSRG
jgi:flagellar biosynthesis anti-sigma factor FlgM